MQVTTFEDLYDNRGTALCQGRTNREIIIGLSAFVGIWRFHLMDDKHPESNKHNWVGECVFVLFKPCSFVIVSGIIASRHKRNYNGTLRA